MGYNYGKPSFIRDYKREVNANLFLIQSHMKRTIEESGLKEGTMGALIYYRMNGGGVNSVNETNIHGFEVDPSIRPTV